MNLTEILSQVVQLSNGVKILNVTPHTLTFGMDENMVEEVAPSGFVVSATLTEEVVQRNNNVTFVATRFVPLAEQQYILEALQPFVVENQIVVLGSMIAAQAYPGLVVAGIQRNPDRKIPQAERVYRTYPDKFTVFGY